MPRIVRGITIWFRNLNCWMNMMLCKMKILIRIRRCLGSIQIPLFQVLLGIAPVVNKLLTMDQKTFMERLQNRVQKKPETGAPDPSIYENMPLNQLGEMKQSDGKHVGKMIKVAAKDDDYVLWLLQHHGQNPKFQALLTYARRAEALNTGDAPSGVTVPKADEEPETIPKSSQLQDTKSILKHAKSLMTSAPDKGTAKVQNDPMAGSSNIPVGDPLQMSQLLMEIDVVKNQVSNYQAHSLQIQEALMQLHNHMMGHQEELTRLGHRLTTLEVQVEAMDFSIVHQG